MEVVILAAGKGTRMYSSMPKVLHEIGARPMLSHVLDTAYGLQPSAIHVVVGYGSDQVRSYYADASNHPINWVQQTEQLGTGHAVQQAINAIDTSTDNNQVLVLFGDVPLITVASLQALLEKANADSVSLLTVETSEPSGLGRIIRDESGAVTSIVEHRDATAEQLEINEVNTGLMSLPAAKLSRWLNGLGNHNDQKEYYLTDIIEIAAGEGLLINAVLATDEQEVMGVNNKLQLALLERHYQEREVETLLMQGVTMRDPHRVDIRGTLSCGQDVEIDCNVIFEGNVVLGNNVSIGANCVISQAHIGDGSQILPGTQIDEAEIGHNNVIGPMARIRPGTVLESGVKVGNFVEIKNSVLGPGSKANHLAYIGDAQIGSGCNVGAGTIFCNYDGANKHKTTLGNNVFIGSNSTLVAPVTLNDDVFVAAGSTINSEVPGNNLAVARSRQRNIEGWKRPQKKAD